MIDVDWLETQLEHAVDGSGIAPAPLGPAAGAPQSKVTPPPSPAMPFQPPAARFEPPTAQFVPAAPPPPPPPPVPPPAGHDWNEQRFRSVLESGDDDARYDLLDRCRQRAYTDDDLVWRGALTVVLARMGRYDEARREIDATASRHKLAGLDPSGAAFIQAKLAEAEAVLAPEVQLTSS